MSRAVLLVSLVVIAASLYVILLPNFKEERVTGKIRVQPVDIQDVKIEEIRVKYGEKTFSLDPNTQEAQKLLYHVQQMLPQLEVELGNLSALMSEEEVEELMRNNNYVLIVLEGEYPISFGKISYPCRRLVVFLSGEHVGKVGVQPAGGARQQVEPKWELAEIPEGDSNFSAVIDLIEEIS